MVNYASDVEAVKALQQKYNELRQAVGQVIVGQMDVVEKLIISILCNGHSLLVGVPGLAKTLLVKTVADALDLSFKRIQFTPDLMPGDITGAEILDEHRKFKFIKGPIFANILLADEINRTPPKTQAALLEAMQERNVTASGDEYKLPAPFFVLATQNPIEFEGTYSLPEAQLDRFLMKIKLGYPDEASEKRLVMEPGASRAAESLQAVATVEDIARMQKLAEGIHLESTVADYLIAFIRGTRQHASVLLGASPRAAVALTSAAKAYAFLNHRAFVLPDDVKAMAPLVLGHRIHLRSEARMQGVTTAQVLQDVLRLLPVPVGMER